MKPVIFHHDAETEMHAAIGYYEEQAQGLGVELQSQFLDVSVIIKTASEETRN